MCGIVSWGPDFRQRRDDLRVLECMRCVCFSDFNLEMDESFCWTGFHLTPRDRSRGNGTGCEIWGLGLSGCGVVGENNIFVGTKYDHNSDSHQLWGRDRVLNRVPKNQSYELGSREHSSSRCGKKVLHRVPKPVSSLAVGSTRLLRESGRKKDAD